MANVPLDTRFIGISTSVNLDERRSATINAETQPYSMQDIVDTAGVSYLKYVALLTQSGTDAPVAIVLENTIGNVLLTYDDIGSYSAILPSSFDTNKIFLSFGAEVNKNNPFIERSIELDTPYSITNNQINIFTSSLLVTDGYLTDNAENNMLINVPIEIRVYP